MRAVCAVLVPTACDGGTVGSVAFSPDGKLLAAGRYSGVVEIRNTAGQ